MDAVREAIEHEMAADPDVWVAGIDVGAGGNVFALFRGLAERFPGRFRDTPISESAIVGCAVGAAMAGARPIVEIMYMDFIGVCLDALMNQAAKLQFMTGGNTQTAARRTHSDRGRPIVRQPALPEPGSRARAHPGPDGGHAVEPGRRLRAIARGDS